MSDEAQKHRKAAADHLRKSQEATTPDEKASETRISKSHQTMADNQNWLDEERRKAAGRELEKGK